VRAFWGPRAQLQHFTNQWRSYSTPESTLAVSEMCESLEEERSKVHEITANGQSLNERGRGAALARRGVSKWRNGSCQKHKVGSVRRFALIWNPDRAPCLAGIPKWLCTFCTFILREKSPGGRFQISNPLSVLLYPCEIATIWHLSRCTL